MLVLLSALLFATTGTSRALGPTADDLSVGAVRVIVGGVALGLVALLVRRRIAGRTPLTGRPAALVAIGAAGVLLYQPMFFAGTRLTGVAVGTVLALGSAPVFTGILDSLVRRNRPGRAWYLSTTVAIIGLVVLVASGRTDGASVSIVGAGACLAAGFGYAVYASAAKALLDRNWTPVTTLGAMFGGAAVVALVVVAAAAVLPRTATVDISWVLAPGGWALALWLGLITVTVAYVLYARGLRTMSAATAATLTMAEPVAATILGVALLGEHPSLGAWAGVALIGCGLAILVVDTVRRRDPDRPTPETPRPDRPTPGTLSPDTRPAVAAIPAEPPASTDSVRR